jgi:hypothetical protein
LTGWLAAFRPGTGWTNEEALSWDERLVLTVLRREVEDLLGRGQP